jgi:signal transduction histidine kinase
MLYSSMAHELRTPLNSILPMSYTLLKYVQHEKGKLILKIISNSAIHLLHIIEDVLDMSRIENGKFEVMYELCDIRNTVKEVNEIMEFQV